MYPVITTFSVPKSGNSFEEYEDACDFCLPDRSDGIVRLAAADGATESSFSALWARLLVRAYIRRSGEPWLLERDLPRLSKIWRRCIGERALPWYAEQKLESGAYSSFLGVSIVINDSNDRGIWTATAVGDTCLFQIREGGVIEGFPLHRSEMFGHRPFLVSSSVAANANLKSRIIETSGEAQSGDTMLLMTDALACWFLKSYEMGSDPLLTLGDVREQSDFESLINSLRKNDRAGPAILKNDDVTMVRCVLI